MKKFIPKAYNSIRNIGTIEIPAIVQSFIVKERFVPDVRSATVVKIQSINDHFQEKYLEKTEGPSGETKLLCGEMVNVMKDNLIIKWIGSKERAEVTLMEFYFLMRKQGCGELGALFGSGHTNIIYVRDIYGALGKLAFFWKGLGWVLNSCDLNSKQTSASRVLFHA